MPRILILEDSAEIQSLLSDLFAQESCNVISGTSVKEARILLEKEQFDLILLDLTLSDGDSLKLCTHVRQTETIKNIPIIVMTGRTDIEDKELAFSVGADDYIEKPFNRRELRARVVFRLQRRLQFQEHNYTIGNLRFSGPLQRVVVFENSKEIPLDFTPLEFKILYYFSSREDHIISRDQVISRVWGENVHLYERIVDTHVSNIRKKLNNHNSDYSIKSVHGSGYKFCKKYKKL